MHHSQFNDFLFGQKAALFLYIKWMIHFRGTPDHYEKFPGCIRALEVQMI